MHDTRNKVKHTKQQHTLSIHAHQVTEEDRWVTGAFNNCQALSWLINSNLGNA